MALVVASGQNEKCGGFYTYAHFTPLGRLFYIGKTIELAGSNDIRRAGFDPVRVRACAVGLRPSHKGFVWQRMVMGEEKC